MSRANPAKMTRVWTAMVSRGKDIFMRAPASISHIAIVRMIADAHPFRIKLIETEAASVEAGRVKEGKDKPQQNEDDNRDVQDFLDLRLHRHISIYQPHDDPDNDEDNDKGDQVHDPAFFQFGLNGTGDSLQVVDDPVDVFPKTEVPGCQKGVGRRPLIKNRQAEPPAVSISCLGPRVAQREDQFAGSGYIGQDHRYLVAEGDRVGSGCRSAIY